MHVTISTGRRVGVHRLAEGPGRTIVLCHAAPGSGLFDPDPEQTRDRGITLLAVDRAGYGESDPPKPGTWADVPAAVDDLLEVLQLEGVGRVSVAGWSAGGRVALALAASEPELVERVCVIATPAPDEAVPWYPDEVRGAIAALQGLLPDEAHAAMVGQLSAMVPSDPRSREALGLLGHTPADEVSALPREGAAERLGEMLAHAFEQGAIGMATDIAGYTLRPWGVEPADVRTRTLLLYGSADAIGTRHGSWWQRHLPSARLETMPRAGHLLVIPGWRRVLQFLTSG